MNRNKISFVAITLRIILRYCKFLIISHLYILERLRSNGQNQEQYKEETASKEKTLQ